VSEGRFAGGIQYLRLGQGQPLLMLGRGSAAGNPTGMARRMALSGLGSLPDHFTIYLAAMPSDLAPGSSMGDIAARYTSFIDETFDGPVLVHGVSSGGMILLQAAIDQPRLIRRMVLAGTGCRLSPQGRRWNAEAVQAIQAGDYRTALARMSAPMVARRWRGPVAALAWLAGPLLLTGDPTDTIVELGAEIAMDLEPDLHRIPVPALVIGASDDAWYPPELVRHTATGMPLGRAVILPQASHSQAISSREATAIALGYLLADQQ
jgi:pimeloyl-ACP methyl ester carboxylesterase